MTNISLTINRAEHSRSNPFVTVSTEIARNMKLSFAARGFLMFVLSHTNGWRVNSRDLKEHGLGRDAVRSLLAELEEQGYVRRSKERNERGHYAGMIVEVYETPVADKTEQPAEVRHGEEDPHDKAAGFDKCESSAESPETGYPALDEPSPDEPAPDNPHHKRINIKKRIKFRVNQASKSSKKENLSNPSGVNNPPATRAEREMIFSKPLLTLISTVQGTANFDALEAAIIRLGEERVIDVLKRCHATKGEGIHWGYVASALGNEPLAPPSSAPPPSPTPGGDVVVFDPAHKPAGDAVGRYLTNQNLLDQARAVQDAINARPRKGNDYLQSRWGKIKSLLSQNCAEYAPLFEAIDPIRLQDKGCVNWTLSVPEFLRDVALDFSYKIVEALKLHHRSDVQLAWKFEPFEVATAGTASVSSGAGQPLLSGKYADYFQR